MCQCLKSTNCVSCTSFLGVCIYFIFCLISLLNNLRRKNIDHNRIVNGYIYIFLMEIPSRLFMLQSWITYKKNKNVHSFNNIVFATYFYYFSSLCTVCFEARIYNIFSKQHGHANSYLFFVLVWVSNVTACSKF